MARKKNNKNQNNKKDTYFTITFLGIVLVGVIIMLLSYAGVIKGSIKGNVKTDMHTGEEVIGVKSYPQDVNTSKETIDIPGYEVITFKHGTIQQKTNFYNPKDNVCFFKLKLYLEDGTTIWESDYLEPGVSYTHIEINQKMKKGRYNNATLSYETYSLNDFKRLNGSNINLVIDVK